MARGMVVLIRSHIRGKSTDIQRRSQTLYTCTVVFVSHAHRAQIGGFWVFADHQGWNFPMAMEAIACPFLSLAMMPLDQCQPSVYSLPLVGLVPFCYFAQCPECSQFSKFKIRGLPTTHAKTTTKQMRPQWHPIHRFKSPDWLKEGHMTWIIFDNVHVWKLIHVC